VRLGCVLDLARAAPVRLTVPYAVAELVVAAQPTAVVRGTTSWAEFPALWPRLLDEVWAAVRSSGAIAPGRNVMLYLDDAPSVEIGVEVAGPFAPIGRVVPSALPAGRAATAHGTVGEIAAAHDAVIAWCDDRGLERTGVRWEVYGHERDESAGVDVDVFWLLR
jgi:effector-binding domain-containing protein